MVRRKKLSQAIFDVVTLFPKMFTGPVEESLLGRARAAGLIDVRVWDLRQWSVDVRHRKVDDRPFGGGAGMVIAVEPVFQAIRALGGAQKGGPHVVLLSPQGAPFTQAKAAALAKRGRVILLCGHYEGIDERIAPWVDEEISIGDVVLTGGELPAMVVIDAVARLIPGVVGDPRSLEDESFQKGRLDYPHYTRPRVWRGRAAPAVLLSGDHARISAWRAAEALKATRRKRPDLLAAEQIAVRQTSRRRPKARRS